MSSIDYSEYDHSRINNDFIEIKPIGSGDSGEVWAVKSKTDKKQYAIKIMHLDEDPFDVAKEIGVLANIRHINVVDYRTSWSDVATLKETIINEKNKFKQQSFNLFYIQMEYCEKTLRQLIDEKEVLHNYSLTWDYFRQILTGLKHIHGLKIKHRDIKPANIFITNNTASTL
jgi:serine/threonine protein kinase